MLKLKIQKGGGGGDWGGENSLQEEEKSYPDWALAIPLVRLLERIAWELKKVPRLFFGNLLQYSVGKSVQ